MRAHLRLLFVAALLAGCSNSLKEDLAACKGVSCTAGECISNGGQPQCICGAVESALGLTCEISDQNDDPQQATRLEVDGGLLAATFQVRPGAADVDDYVFTASGHAAYLVYVRPGTASDVAFSDGTGPFDGDGPEPGSLERLYFASGPQDIGFQLTSPGRQIGSYQVGVRGLGGGAPLIPEGSSLSGSMSLEGTFYLPMQAYALPVTGAYQHLYRVTCHLDGGAPCPVALKSNQYPLSHDFALPGVDIGSSWFSVPTDLQLGRFYWPPGGIGLNEEFAATPFAATFEDLGAVTQPTLTADAGTLNVPYVLDFEDLYLGCPSGEVCALNSDCRVEYRDGSEAETFSTDYVPGEDSGTLFWDVGVGGFASCDFALGAVGPDIPPDGFAFDGGTLAGRIDYPGDVDRITLVLDDPRPACIDYSCATCNVGTGGSAGVWSKYAGSTSFDLYLGGSERADYVFTASPTYYDPSQAQPLSLGATASGEFPCFAATARYAIDLAANTAYRVDDLQARFLGAFEVTDADGGTYPTQFTSGAAGTYFVQVFANDESPSNFPEPYAFQVVTN